MTNTQRNETLDRALTDVLTLAIILTVIGGICIFTMPGVVETSNVVIPTIHTTVGGSPNVTTVDVNDTLIITFPDSPEPTEIESLISNLMRVNPAEKAQYSRYADGIDEVHVCMNMAVDQSEWIIENHNYTAGIVMLYSKYIGDNHAQTWVNVAGTQYVIDSTSDHYWTSEEHKDLWGDKYKIKYLTMEKGQELEKENNERINNKDEPQIDV